MNIFLEETFHESVFGNICANSVPVNPACSWDQQLWDPNSLIPTSHVFKAK